MRADLESSKFHETQWRSGRWSATHRDIAEEYEVRDGSTIIHFLAPTGEQNVRLPSLGEGKIFVVSNVGTADDLNIISSNGQDVTYLHPGETTFLFSDETEWLALRAWGDLDDFGYAGPDHHRGLVPDPGPVADPDPTHRRFLSELGWMEITEISGDDFIKYLEAGGVTINPVGAESIEFLSANDRLTLLADDTAKTITWTLVEANIDHNALTNYVADQHVPHSSINLTAGIGLSGGGTIDASRSFQLDLSDLVVETPVLDDTFAFYDVSGVDTNKATLSALNAIFDHNSLLNYEPNRHIDHTTVAISAGTGLTGGGNIDASRVISLDINGLSVDTIATGDFLAFYDISSADHNKITLANLNAGLDHNALANYVAAQHVSHFSVSITAGNGLTGGGDISTSRTLHVGVGAGLAVAADAVSLAPIADDRILANISGATAAPSANTLTAIIDACIGSTQGQILYRDSTSWVALNVGTDGYVLTLASGLPSWAASTGGGSGISPMDYGAVGDGVTDDVTAVDTAIAALTAGMTLDGEGKTYAYSGNSARDIPENCTVRNATFKLVGVSATQHMFNPRGTQTSLTYTGGSIAQGATSLSNVAGLTSADIGKALWISSTDTVATGFLRGEMNFIRSVSGTTIGLENAMRLAYSTSPAVALLTLKRGVQFKNVKFIGDPTKTQRGVTFERCADSQSEIYGENMGHYTVARIRCHRMHVSGGGSNHGITTDNGLDYFCVDVNGNLQCSADVKGTAYRHVYASGATDGIDFDTHVNAWGIAMKDSVVDAHPGVMNFTVRVKQSGVRNGGTFSSQPIGLMYQGGGLLDAVVEVDGYDTLAAVVQLLQNTKDAIKITVNAVNPTSAATMGLDIQVTKPGGSVDYIDAYCNTGFMSNAASVGMNLDTSGSVSALNIAWVKFRGNTSGRVSGMRVISRATHVIEHVDVSGTASYQLTGGVGVDILAINAGGILSANAHGITVRGTAGSLGIRVSNVTTSLATGNLVTGVGGGAITTNAIVGFTSQAANHYT